MFMDRKTKKMEPAQYNNKTNISVLFIFARVWCAFIGFHYMLFVLFVGYYSAFSLASIALIIASLMMAFMSTDNSSVKRTVSGVFFLIGITAIIYINYPFNTFQKGPYVYWLSALAAFIVVGYYRFFAKEHISNEKYTDWSKYKEKGYKVAEKHFNKPVHLDDYVVRSSLTKEQINNEISTGTRKAYVYKHNVFIESD
jgi:hypothetical protein